VLLKIQQLLDFKKEGLYTPLWWVWDVKVMMWRFVTFVMLNE